MPRVHFEFQSQHELLRAAIVENTQPATANTPSSQVGSRITYRGGMDIALHILVIPLLGFFFTRGALALAHAFDWRPEEQLVCWLKRTVREIRWQWTRIPRIDAPGLKWRKYTRNVVAYWKPTKRGYPVRKYRLWMGQMKDLELLDRPFKDHIADMCRTLQADHDAWAPPSKPKPAQNALSLEEILQTIRKIISDDEPRDTAAPG